MCPLRSNLRRLELRGPGTDVRQCGIQLSYAVFLAIADFQGYQVESYEDNPVGHLESNDKKGRPKAASRQLNPA